MGALCSSGINVPEIWQNVLAGNSGAHSVTPFDTSDFSTKFAATTINFDITPYMSLKNARKVDIFVQYAVAAAQQALEDSGLTIDDNNAERIGVAIGSGIGGLPSIVKNEQALESKGPRKISPFFIPGSIVNMAAGYVAIQFGCKGPNFSIVTACTTGSHNIGNAARTIAYGDADMMLAGGAEMATTPLGLGGFSALRALSTRNDEPTKASRPWDKDRDGFVLADGAGVLMLEEYEHAKARGATIYAEVAGLGMSADAHHLTMPSQNGMERSMNNALNDAGLNPDEVDYINAHATSTPAGDPIEAMAVKEAFGDHATKLCMSSTKSMTGHLLGAAGSIEAIFSILAIRDNVAPPTINLDNPDDIYADLNLVPHTAQQRPINITLSNSFGFGGTNGSLIFKAV
tara:strand:- start:168126 stop:169331 length:1206 start_codon:yes stop_codon:yes gene_type:complete